jgi:preprotein translocase subunit YajC
MGALLILAVTFGLMWVLFILPQQRRVRAHQALVSTVAVGDEVMTTAGVFGVVKSLDAEVAELEVAPGVVMRFARGAIARRVDQVLAEGDAGGDALADVAGDDPGLAAPAVRPRRGLSRRRASSDGGVFGGPPDDSTPAE